MSFNSVFLLIFLGHVLIESNAFLHLFIDATPQFFTPLIAFLVLFVQEELEVVVRYWHWQHSHSS